MTTAEIRPVTAGKKQRSPWWVIIGAGIAGMCAPGPVSLGTLGLFVLPMNAELGWSRTQVSAGFTFAAFGMAIGLVVVGRLLDRLAVRWIIIPSFLGYATVFALLAAVGKDSLPLYYTLHFLVGLLGSGTSIPFSKALVSWFDNRRGMAIGVMTGFWGLGSSLMPLLASPLITLFGWRGAYVVLALLVMIVATSAVSALVRVRAERSLRGRLVKEVVDARSASVVTLDVPGLTFRQALRSRQFWMITLGLGMAGLTVTGIQVSLVPMMVDRGIEPAQAAFLLTILGLSGLVGRVAGGFVIDRVPGRIIGAVVVLIPIAGLLFLRPPFAVVAVAVAVIGLALGIENDLVVFFITRYLGTREYGRIVGVIQAAFLMTSAFGPVVFSAAHDQFGSYSTIIPVFIVGLVVSAIVILLLGRYRYPAVRGFDQLAAKDELAAAEILSEQAGREGNTTPAAEGAQR
ncbi:MFS transporter [Acrocarpospora macrocephala]|uniref:MFS transporter n=1 Tax=Acrocarpospora macrocephala TaxID=150177 RepID=A0A5M3WPU7_9ACTN|nr:MFS transporter [Acrocarpospora macrocephala]GES11285.1 MFS transporter [Acrocarpospora macrocephala]